MYPLPEIRQQKGYRPDRHWAGEMAGEYFPGYFSGCDMGAAARSGNVHEGLYGTVTPDFVNLSIGLRAPQLYEEAAPYYYEGPGRPFYPP